MVVLVGVLVVMEGVVVGVMAAVVGAEAWGSLWVSAAQGMWWCGPRCQAVE